MIVKITKAYVRTYSDTGQTKAYVEWVDHRKQTGRTEGSPWSLHIHELMCRAQREGVEVERQRW